MKMLADGVRCRRSSVEGGGERERERKRDPRCCGGSRGEMVKDFSKSFCSVWGVIDRTKWALA